MPEVSIPGIGIVHFPHGMSEADIATQAKRLHDEAQQPKAKLMPSHNSAADAPPRREIFGKPVPTLQEALASDTPSDAAVLKRAPEIFGMAGMIAAGPFGAGAGAAAGSLVKGQAERGLHVPTSGDLGDAAIEGGKSMALSAVPGLGRVAAERVGPVLTNNARGISRGISAASGIGAGLASGNPLTGIGMGAATRMLTSPSGIRATGEAATRLGEAPMHAINKTGFGLLNVRALLDALAEEQP